MSRREDGKADRRQRILSAARELIRETGDAGLSMRAIAARANVSLATPYNLFGSKRAIVTAVLEDVRDFEKRFSNLKTEDPIDRLFKALAITLSYHIDDPDFYRTLWTALLDMRGGGEIRTELLTPQNHFFWKSLLDAAAREGRLRADTDLEALLQNMNFIFGSVMLGWIMGAIETDQIEPAIGYGYALSLAGAASEAEQPRALARVQEFQARRRVTPPVAQAS